MKYLFFAITNILLLSACQNKTAVTPTSASNLEVINKLDTATFLLLVKGELKEAGDSARLLISKSEDIFYKKGIATGYKWLGMTKLLSGSREEAKPILEKGYAVIENEGDEYPLKAYFVLRLAECYHATGDSKKEMQMIITALKLESLTDNPKTSVDLNNYLGNYHIDRLNLDSSIIHLMNAYRSSEKIENFDRIKSAIALNLGKALVARGNYEDAKEYFDIAYQIKAPDGKIGDSTGIATLYLNLETLYSKQDSTDLAIEYATKAYNLSKSISNQALNVNATANLGALFILKKDYPKSIKYLNEATIGAKGINDNYLLCGNYGNLGVLYQKYYKDFNQAEAYLLQSLTIADTSNYTDLKLNAYDYLSKVYFDKKEYNKAYVMLDSFVNSSAEVFKKESLNTIDSLTKVYDLYKKEAENKALTTEKEQLISQAQNRKIIIGSLILFLILAAFIIWYIEQQRKKIATQNKKVEIKNIELEKSYKAQMSANDDLKNRNKEKIADKEAEIIQKTALLANQKETHDQKQSKLKNEKERLETELLFLKQEGDSFDNQNSILQYKLAALNSTETLIKLYSKKENYHISIMSNHIAYIKTGEKNTVKNTCTFYDIDNNSIGAKKIGLKNLPAELPEYFIQLSSKSIVNIYVVKGIIKVRSSSKALLINGEKIDITNKTNEANLQKAIERYLLNSNSENSAE